MPFFSFQTKKTITLTLAGLLFFVTSIKAQFNTYGPTGSRPIGIAIDAAGDVYTTNAVR
jgi:hypothetical protein